MTIVLPWQTPVDTLSHRKLFSHIPAPNERGHHLERLLDLFSHRYLQCNPQATYTKGKGESKGHPRITNVPPTLSTLSIPPSPQPLPHPYLSAPPLPSPSPSPQIQCISSVTRSSSSVLTLLLPASRTKCPNGSSSETYAELPPALMMRHSVTCMTTFTCVDT